MQSLPIIALKPSSREIRGQLESLSFDQLFGIIRLAHKYHIEAIEQKGLKLLNEYFEFEAGDWFKSHTDYGAFRSGCNPIGVINIARLTDTPSLLPGAFYFTCFKGSGLVDGWKREDGSVEHLSRDDLRRCMDGGTELAHYMNTLRTQIFLHNHPHGDCTSEAQCLASAVTMLLTANTIDIGSNTTFFTSWRSFIENYSTTHAPLCYSCIDAMFLREAQIRLEMWYTMLPSIFRLTV